MTYAEFTSLVHAAVGPLVEPVGFKPRFAPGEPPTPPPGYGPDEWRPALSILYEAPPEPFAQNYPGLMSDYGDQPIPCIDLWIEYRPEPGGVTATLEAADLARWLLGHGQDRLARTLETADIERAVEALAAGLRIMLDEERR
jgi:hypothetical protein